MHRPSLIPSRHDPFWDLDGSAARRSRVQRRVFRVGLILFAALFVGVVASRLPAFDPALITSNGSLRPILAVALLALLLACVLVAGARMRHQSTEG
jgi:hypothetical protein